MTHDTTKGMNEAQERRAFEAVAAAKGLNIKPCRRSLIGGYLYTDTDIAWEIWQAAKASIPSEPEQAENNQLTTDAERLDYIASNARCNPKMDGQHVWWPTTFDHRLVGPNLRAAIDASMAHRAGL